MSDGKFIDDFEVSDISNVKMRSVYEYWLKIRGDRSIPSRADINPAEIASILPHICLVRVEEGTSRYKLTLVGSENVKAMNSDLTGKYLDEIPELQKYAKERYDWVVENKRPYIYQGGLDWSPKDYMEYSIIGLPLSNDNDKVDGIMFAGFYYYPNREGSEKSVAVG